MSIIAYALFLYFSGLSLRSVSATLTMLGVKRSHEAIRKWVHKFGASIWQVIPAKAGERDVVDETLVKFAGQRVYLWVALEPENRALIWLDTSVGRSWGDAHEFLKELRRKGVKKVITDRGRWYLRAAAEAELEHDMSGGQELRREGD